MMLIQYDIGTIKCLCAFNTNVNKVKMMHLRYQFFVTYIMIFFTKKNYHDFTILTLLENLRKNQICTTIAKKRPFHNIDLGLGI